MDNTGAAANTAILTLVCGNLRADVAPEVGGSLSAFYTPQSRDHAAPRRDWLRPATDIALALRDPLGMASFPLLPWCNRLRDGRFDWDTRTVQLAPNFGASPHTIHGLGWRHAWRVDAVDGHRVGLSYAHDGRGEWPFPFEARQRYELDAGGLTIEIELTNTGDTRMPADLGHHPYFAHRREGTGTWVQANVQRIWESDGEDMPLQTSTTHPAVAALRQGMRLDDHALDNNFTGFGHHASVRWPDGSGLTLKTDSPLDQFVLFSPADQALFCMEAVSNCTDWINLRARDAESPVGGHALPPGQSLRASIRLEPKRPGQGTSSERT